MSSSDVKPPVLPEIFGPYRIVRPLGKGGMGAVYLAHDTRLDRDVALKVCSFADNALAMARFRREAKAAASLSHTNLCPVYEFDVRDSIAYLTMAFIEGLTLNAWVAQRGSISQREAARLVAKLAIAMQTAHEAGVVHRDLKPTNVVINKKLEPIILDFGLARQMEDEGTRLTLVGSIYGTPSYMAPEQAGGDPTEIGPACDIYGLGVILYELLTGRVPFEGSFTAVMGQLLTVNPTPLRVLNPAVAPVLEAICLKALAKKPSDRHKNMRELAKELTKVGPTLTGTVGMPTARNQPNASTSPENLGKRTPARDESSRQRGAGAAPEFDLLLPLTAPDSDRGRPVPLPTKSKGPPPLPPMRRHVEEETDWDRLEDESSSNYRTAWIIGSVSATVLLLFIVILVVVLNRSDSTSSNDSETSSGDERQAFAPAARRIQSQNNLKQIGIALHAYHDTNGVFPPATITDAEGRPLYSWRVALLPYIEESTLFNQWQKNEPWDGPNNRLLWSRTPKCYQLPGKPGDGTQTYYQGFTGTGTAFGNPQGIRTTDVLDGLSNTIFVVEASNPVVWCAPQDIPFTPSPNGFSPRQLGGYFGSSVQVLLGDGSVRSLPWSMSAHDFQDAITINDGKVFNWPD